MKRRIIDEDDDAATVRWLKSLGIYPTTIVGQTAGETGRDYAEDDDDEEDIADTVKYFGSSFWYRHKSDVADGDTVWYAGQESYEDDLKTLPSNFEVAYNTDESDYEIASDSPGLLALWYGASAVSKAGVSDSIDSTSDAHWLKAMGITPTTMVGETAREIARDYGRGDDEEDIEDAVKYYQQKLWYRFVSERGPYRPGEGNRRGQTFNRLPGGYASVIDGDYEIASSDPEILDFWYD